MTYYFLNENKIMQKKVGGDPPAATFVGVSPDGIMRKFENGNLISALPIKNEKFEEQNAAILLGIAQSNRNKKKNKSKSKRKCRCK